MRGLFKRRRLTALAAVMVLPVISGSSASAVFENQSSNPHPFIEYKRWADASDVAAVSLSASGAFVPDNGIRYDVDNNGVVSQRDADLLQEYLCFYEMFDAVSSYVHMNLEITELFTMEMTEEFGSPVVLDPVISIADGGFTGYAVQYDPYTGDFVYDRAYETGDIVVIFNVYTDGDFSIIRRQEEIVFGNVADLGFSYQPRQEIVENALRNFE